ncbi:XRN 5'-3' exonuclease N-terminus-domain-containing protein [Dipodascopsis tothii]|uniref:XRN 5'-3' exonuclease N-terminus-domain-containing protein n=1 Tax=Dipodascopsis tothii TaxID=44089 RepID=UPI0034CD8233
MGIPKFFRWISERYPLISKVVDESNIPQFDNLYLDMNGILHNCSHKDADDTSFRISEDRMYMAIFSYIELLFEKVKPQKMFFMAIDGVAPRAKMNQQRARRFKTAMSAEEARQKARRSGEEEPKDPPFDSNAITPGTEFMAKLTLQLKYFVTKKVSEDSRWRNIDIVLSGHEVPGEGEHKIMEYIRKTKAAAGYNPNTRHCLYGLDADLIMLGLVSHDPHFCLLREEVTFDSGRNKPKELAQQKFYLMHLALVREYLELEFADLKSQLSFEYSFERVIDDFILMAIFVGNDFLPNLPQLHINDGALSLMFAAYKKALVKCTGYINNYGTIDMENLRVLLKELSPFEIGAFQEETNNGHSAPKKAKKGEKTLTRQQHQLFDILDQHICQVLLNPAHSVPAINLPLVMVGDEKLFLDELLVTVGLQSQVIPGPDGQPYLSVSLAPYQDPAQPLDEDDKFNVQQVLDKYRSATVVDGGDDEDDELLANFRAWKDNYYRTKLKFSFYDEQNLRALCENYVQGLQWVLNYYYKGVSSWSWFYSYHYAPKISDIARGLGADVDFKIGEPLHPFEQLMGVLPDLSNKLIPSAYRHLMSNPDSPILDFYPKEFELDLNGKKAEWEAVVLIPFVEEARLLKAMKDCEHLLTADERKRNGFGEMLKFSFDPTVDVSYESPLPGHFVNLEHSHCVVSDYFFPAFQPTPVANSLCAGVLLGVQSLAGFPSLYTIPHTSQLTRKHHVNVFQQDSKRDAIVVTIANQYGDMDAMDAAVELIGKHTYVEWPYLREAMVVAVSDDTFRYESLLINGKYEIMPSAHSQKDADQVRRMGTRLASDYARLGVVIGEAKVLLHLRPLAGLMLTANGALVKRYDGDRTRELTAAIQTTVRTVVNEDSRFRERAPLTIENEYPIGTWGFFLGGFAYGQPLQVTRVASPETVDVWLSVSKDDVHTGTTIAMKERHSLQYFPSSTVATKLKLTNLLVSKITSSFMVTTGNDKNVNIGLQLKFESKQQKVMGYTRRGTMGWEFSQKAVDLIHEYVQKFPDLFAGLKKPANGDFPAIATVLKVPEDKARERLDEIRAWLKQVGVRDFERVSLDCEQLTPESVKEIEAMADKLVEQARAAPARTTMVRNVPRRGILKPSDAIHKLGGQTFRLGDRVLYVQDSGAVPIGIKGTVVGLITLSNGQRALDVVFDHTFMGGSALNNRCSIDRGRTVDYASVLNLTTHELQIQTKAQAGQKTAPKAAPKTRPAGQNGSNGQGPQRQPSKGQPRPNPNGRPQGKRGPNSGPGPNVPNGSNGANAPKGKPKGAIKNGSVGGKKPAVAVSQ